MVQGPRYRNLCRTWYVELENVVLTNIGCFFKHPPGLQRALESNKRLSVENLPRIGSTSSMASASGEHSVYKLLDPSTGWHAIVDQIDSSWRTTILPLFQHYSERTPGSFIEEKEINLTWHYRNADPEFGIWQATELQVNLEKILSHLPVSIILGNKTLELRPSSIDKATAAKAILADLDASTQADFLLCIGDGKNDEGLFGILTEPWQYTVTVGKKRTEAHFYLDSVRDVEGLITDLSNF